MGYWSLVLSEATKNYLPNPSLELGTTGYSNHASGTASGTRTRTLEWQKRDAYSYKIVKSGGGATDQYGFFVTATSPGEFVAGDYATFSVDLNITAGTVRVRIQADTGAVVGTNLDVTTSGRKTVTVGPLAGTATSVVGYVFLLSETGTFYADGLQIERKSYATSYCDGTRKGCVWNGKPHASTSSRSAQSRAGGREYNLDDLGYYVLESPGIGMPPVSHYAFPQAALPGALLRGYRVGTRTISLVVINNPSTRADLHSKRKALIDAIKPDRTKDFDTFPLRYIGANSSQAAEIMVAYDAGLEFASPDGFSETVGVRLLAYDPLWVADGDTADALDGITAIASADCALRRHNGIWTETGIGGTWSIYDIVGAPDGTIYISGDFTNIGDANGDGIVSYNPDTGAFTSLGTGVAASGAIYCMAVAPNGDLYVGGNFTSVGGVANTANLARWRPGTGWQSIATSGADGVVNDLVFDQAGDLYITGAFANVDGAAKAKIAKYVVSTDTWSALGTGLNGNGQSLAISLDNVLYVAGEFTTANGVTVNYVTYWNGTTFVAMGSGTNTTVFELKFAPDGTLYLGGAFTQCSGVAGYNYVAGWNGVNFLALGDGLISTTYMLGIGSDGFLYANKGNGLQMWNGSTWSIADVVLLPVTTLIFQVFVSIGGDDYLGVAATDGLNAYIAAQTTVNNAGTRTAYPQVVIARSGGTSASVQWLRNDTAGDVIHLDYNLLDGETLTLDFTPNARTVTSNYFGQVWRAVSQTSQFSTFRLLPGDNQISLFVYETGSPTITAYIQYRPTYWSADGVAA